MHNLAMQNIQAFLHHFASHHDHKEGSKDNKTPVANTAKDKEALTRRQLTILQDYYDPKFGHASQQ